MVYADRLEEKLVDRDDLDEAGQVASPPHGSHKQNEAAVPLEPRGLPGIAMSKDELVMQDGLRNAAESVGDAAQGAQRETVVLVVP